MEISNYISHTSVGLEGRIPESTADYDGRCFLSAAEADALSGFGGYQSAGGSAAENDDDYDAVDVSTDVIQGAIGSEYVYYVQHFCRCC